MENAEIEGQVRVTGARDGRATVETQLSVAGARPRLDAAEGVPEEYTLRIRESLRVPYVEDGPRTYEASVESDIALRQREGNDISRLIRYTIFERHERSEIPAN